MEKRIILLFCFLLIWQASLCQSQVEASQVNKNADFNYEIENGSSDNNDNFKLNQKLNMVMLFSP
jgi:hypothetical protein